MGHGDLIRLSAAEETLLVDSVTSLLEGGVDLVEAYAAVEHVLSGRPRAAAGALRGALETGVPPAAAARLVLARIDPMHRAMLSIVEETGEALAAFRRARTYLAIRARLRRRTSGAAIYPAFVIAATLAGALLLVTVVLPAAAELLAPLAGAGASSSVPAAISALVGRGRVIVGGAVAAIVLAATAIGWPRRAESGRARWADRLRLRIPIAGSMEATVDLLAYAHGLAGCLGCGVPLGDALGYAPRCVTNGVLRAELVTVARHVRDGMEVSRAFALAREARGAVGGWFLLGERGADVEASIESLARCLEERVERTAERLGTLVEPATVVVAGAFLITIVLALVKPLFELYAVALP
ncbi:MAG: type II secretion system F family protein [Spirochaetota bacterium]